MKTLSRPAVIVDGIDDLGREYSSARWIYHRLLDFEDTHQSVLAAAAERAAPGITRVGRIVSRLSRRIRWSERSTGWSPPLHTPWLTSLRARLIELRAERNASDGWREAMCWADDSEPGAPARGGARRKAGETDEDFAARSAKRRTTLTRREAHRAALYAEHVAVGSSGRSRIHWGTWNGLVKSVDQARAAVLKARKQGLPAEWRRPRWSDDSTLFADTHGFRIVSKDDSGPWWTLELRTHFGWVRFRAKCGNWHEIPESASMRTLKLTRRQKTLGSSGRSTRKGWAYSVSIAIEGVEPAAHTGAGLVALDWGHREHGHPHESEGIRAFTWLGDDGALGEILLPRECREATDAVDEMKARVDGAFNARKSALGLPDRNRHRYRSRLMRAGVRTDEEQLWLTWEDRYEMRMQRARKRVKNLRQETYLKAVRMLRSRYSQFAIEDESIMRHRAADIDKETSHRKRSNRELTARYLFVSICERLGAEMIPVPARNSTRECPKCGHLDENTAELIIVCGGCGTARDKDHGAVQVILRRAKEALEKRLASP